MKSLDRATQLELVAEANRAPSVHNTQPARWRFLPRGDILLFEDRRRRLPVADPGGHDSGISLGAALEGLDLALSKRGLRLETPELVGSSEEGPADTLDLTLVARTALAPASRMDPLAVYPPRRSTCRRSFQPASDAAMKRLTTLCSSLADIVPLFARAEVDEVAALNDRCSCEFLAQPGYQAELYRWTRLAPAHPLWHRDGLNGDTLGLSPIERRCAMLLFRPRVFAMLRAARLASLVVSEAARTRTSSAILILTASNGENPLLTGRRFYRVWLEVCRAGFSLCPMSALADSPRGSRQLQRRYAIAADRRIVNVFRVGLPAGGAVPVSPRLPAEELLV